MTDLTSNYAGIVLRNPIVAASSGQTQTAASIRKLVEAGAAAVVLKSLFEEQIDSLSNSLSQETDYPEATDYIQHYVKNQEIGKYIELVQTAKAENNIPIIASINCYHTGDWTNFAKQIELAGADAIEVNIMRLEARVNADPTTLVREYLSIVKNISTEVKIPIAVKIPNTFSCQIAFIDKTYHSGAQGITLFNRSYRMDIDIENEKISSGSVFTSSADISDTLRYTGLVAAEVPQIPISASTGIHDSKGAIKALLAGASSVQMCSSIYLNGPESITNTLKGLEEWMQRKQYLSIDEFRGRLKAEKGDANLYSRMQFLKYFANHK